MAITPLTSPYKKLTFDGETSASYGVQILGEGVFNAPERDVEMIEIPGRNGAYALDRGRFQNVEVTYPANLIADSATDFADGISNFRNFLCSKKGYARLTDDYNPNEYRMAIYKEGLEVDEKVLRAGEFDITFECMPQRWLTSGETKTTISTSGDTITNPTLFDASPMLEAEGYGGISINGETITVENVALGETAISSKTTSSGTASVALNVDNLNTADEIYTKDKIQVELTVKSAVSNTTIVKLTPNGSPTNGSASYVGGSSSAQMIVKQSLHSFAKGTSGSITTEVPFAVSIRHSGGISATTGTARVVTSYDSSTDTITVSVTAGTQDSTKAKVSGDRYITVPIYYGDSTKTVLPTPMYIDLDIGEAYGETNSVITSFNNIVSMPAELPVLKSGSNVITFDNTISDLKIVPRWWKV